MCNVKRKIMIKTLLINLNYRRNINITVNSVEKRNKINREMKEDTNINYNKNYINSNNNTIIKIFISRYGISNTCRL